MAKRTWSLDEIVERLSVGRQRATYGAIAKLLGRPVRRLMADRPESITNSWVVAKTSNKLSGSRRGWPTGFRLDRIDPDCLAQIRSAPGDFIDDPEELRSFLERQEKDDLRLIEPEGKPRD